MAENENMQPREILDVKDLEAFMASVMDNGYCGDNQQENPDDWTLSGNEDIFDLLPTLKKRDNKIYTYYQYAAKRYNTSCTKFSSINSLASNENQEYTTDMINQVEDESIRRGFVIGNGWSRGQGVDTNRTLRNKWFPQNEMASFQIGWFDDAFEKLRKLKRTFVTSISVDRDFLLDIIDNHQIDKGTYGHTIGHATCIWRNEELGLYEFIDSAFKPLRWTISADTIKKMHASGNMTRTCHVFIPKKVLKMITPDVEANQEYAPAVQWAIDNKITTAGPDRVFEPNRPVTRAELVMMLQRFHENIVKKAK